MRRIKQTIPEGLRTQQELAKADQELQRVYHDAGAYAQQKDHVLEKARAEADGWRNIANQREGTTQ